MKIVVNEDKTDVCDDTDIAKRQYQKCIGM